MKTKKSTPHNIDDIVHSLDGISRAELTPFFYNRVQANLDKRLESNGSFWLLVTKPAVSLATFSLLLILNIAAINYFLKSDKRSVTKGSTGIQGFAQEYDLTTTSVYNDKNIR